ncbi:MAG: DUF896 domain-containing protein [Lachnospiraceae bacterium]|nr:DUF896 domain-containing protein [Lachnospiraceae bacterium]
MTEEGIARINELARKSKTPEGLTPEEKDEQAVLRRQFIDDFKRNLRGVIEQVDILEPDGSVTHVADIPKKKKND